MEIHGWNYGIILVQPSRTVEQLNKNNGGNTVDITLLNSKWNQKTYIINSKLNCIRHKLNNLQSASVLIIYEFRELTHDTCSTLRQIRETRSSKWHADVINFDSMMSSTRFDNVAMNSSNNDTMTSSAIKTSHQVLFAVHGSDNIPNNIFLNIGESCMGLPSSRYA